MTAEDFAVNANQQAVLALPVHNMNRKCSSHEGEGWSEYPRKLDTFENVMPPSSNFVPNIPGMGFSFFANFPEQFLAQVSKTSRKHAYIVLTPLNPTFIQ